MQWTIVGLGNPGSAYTHTRHNVGFLAVDYIRERTSCEAGWTKRLFAKALTANGTIADAPVQFILPQTFMNQSGNAVKKFVKTPEAIAHMIVIHDDVHLPIGTLKISIDRGDGGHNGITSLMDTLKSKAFMRIRVGIAPEKFEGADAPRIKLDDYVLGKFKPEEREVLESLFPKIRKIVEHIITKGLPDAMNVYNAK
jgi:PTH1 family peptidyl-tRNA hydrolase